MIHFVQYPPTFIQNCPPFAHDIATSTSSFHTHRDRRLEPSVRPHAVRTVYGDGDRSWHIQKAGRDRGVEREKLTPVTVLHFKFVRRTFYRDDLSKTELFLTTLFVNGSSLDVSLDICLDICQDISLDVGLDIIRPDVGGSFGWLARCPTSWLFVKRLVVKGFPE